MPDDDPDAGGAVTTPALITEGFRRLPDGPAVVDPDVALSRRQLDTASLRVAQRCCEAGITAGASCAALVPLDVGGVVGFLGAVRSGAAVVGLDPALPEAYVRDVCGRAGVRVAVVTAASEALARAAGLRPVRLDPADTATVWDPARCQEVAAQLPRPAVGDLARISFTSGSTGRPKGVALTHEQDVGSGRRNASTTAGQHNAVLVPFGPGASRRAVVDVADTGSVLHVFDVRVHGLERLVAFLDDQHVDRLRAPVGLFRSLTAALGDRRLRSVRRVNISGEAIHAADLRAFTRCFRPDAELHCVYGASECGGMASLVVRTGDDIPDGPVVYPVVKESQRVTVERPDGSPADVLEVGEIVCRSSRVIAGYVGDPELTAQRFFTGPDGVRGFRTGDRGRIHPGGGLEVLGREDDQVTVRGNNVHLGTVEAALRRLPVVADCAVVAVDRDGGGTRLVAAVVPPAGAAPTVRDLRDGLARDLPAHMVPQRFLHAVSLPRLTNGKVDRAALRRVADDAEPLTLGRAHRDPATATQRRIATVFAEVLGVAAVGADDDFFDLGGDSLAAEELVTRLAGEYGGRVTRGAVLECPTVAALALRVDGATGAGDGLVLLHPGGTGEPLFLAPGGGQEPYDLVRVAHRLGADRPVYSYRSLLYDRRARPDRTVEATASRYLDAYTRRVGRPPRLLAGYSGGAAVALEMAGRLAASGEDVALFASIDGSAPTGTPRRRRPWQDGPPAREVWARVRALSPAQRPLALAKAVTRRPRAWWMDRTLGLVRREHEVQAALLFQASSMAAARYTGRMFAGPSLLVVAEDEPGGRRDEEGWARWLDGPRTRVTVPGDHHTLLREPNVAELAEHLRTAMQEADAADGATSGAHGR